MTLPLLSPTMNAVLLYAVLALVVVNGDPRYTPNAAGAGQCLRRVESVVANLRGGLV